MKTLHDILETITNEKLQVETSEWDNAYDKLLGLLRAIRELTDKNTISEIIDELDFINDSENSVYKNVYTLSKEQLQELKRFYYSQTHESVSMYELANIDDFVSDSEIFKEYDGTSFVDDDFACSCGIIAD